MNKPISLIRLLRLTLLIHYLCFRPINYLSFSVSRELFTKNIQMEFFMLIKFISSSQVFLLFLFVFNTRANY